MAESTNIALYLKTRVILCQINQILETSLAQIFSFVNIFTEESHNTMDVYWVIHCFVEGGQNGNLHLTFRAKLQGGKDDFKKMTASLLYFYIEIGSTISKICWL